MRLSVRAASHCDARNVSRAAARAGQARQRLRANNFPTQHSQSEAMARPKPKPRPKPKMATKMQKNKATTARAARARTPSTSAKAEAKARAKIEPGLPVPDDRARVLALNRARVNQCRMRQRKQKKTDAAAAKATLPQRLMAALVAAKAEGFLPPPTWSLAEAKRLAGKPPANQPATRKPVERRGMIDTIPRTCTLMSATRLRMFQRWLREKAPPGRRHVRLSAEVRRSLRLPQLADQGIYGRRMWLFALVGFWWLRSGERDAISWALLAPVPDWDGLLAVLRLARAVGTDEVRRRGSGSKSPDDLRLIGLIETLQSWRNPIVNGELGIITDSSHPTTTVEAARALKALPGLGAYLCKNVLVSLELAGAATFNGGVIGPGAYSSLLYMLTGAPSCALVKTSLWPWSNDPFALHGHIDRLAQADGMSWQDMQAALCWWAPWRRHPAARRTDTDSDSDSDSDGSGPADPDQCVLDDSGRGAQPGQVGSSPDQDGDVAT